MEIVNKKIEELIPYEKNPRKNDEAVKYVAESIKQFGFKVPIIIDKNNVVVTGHTRLKASKELGLKEVPCIIANDLSDEQIKAFRLADNKVSDYSIWDNKLLLEELDELDESDNSVLTDNKDGVTYVVQFKTQNQELADKVQRFIENETKGETIYE